MMKIMDTKCSQKKMSITTDLEKLVSLRDSSDLSEAEFEKAKERLLSGEVTGVSPSTERNQPPLAQEGEGGKPKHTLLIAILSTIAAALFAGSAAINPSPLKLLAFACFTVVPTLNWIEFSKHRLRK
jgi:tRNA A37 threonylcarbamoyladenosine synthetase subunit TsaC/SUA5/YrdC